MGFFLHAHGRVNFSFGKYQPFLAESSVKNIYRCLRNSPLLFFAFLYFIFAVFYGFILSHLTFLNKQIQLKLFLNLRKIKNAAGRLLTCQLQYFFIILFNANAGAAVKLPHFRFYAVHNKQVYHAVIHNYFF